MYPTSCSPCFSLAIFPQRVKPRIAFLVSSIVKHLNPPASRKYKDFFVWDGPSLFKKSRKPFCFLPESNLLSSRSFGGIFLRKGEINEMSLIKTLFVVQLLPAH